MSKEGESAYREFFGETVLERATRESRERSKLPAPSMANQDGLHLRIIRHAAAYSNEHLIDALCVMAHEDPTPNEAIALGLRKLSVSRALLRCPENQED